MATLNDPEVQKLLTDPNYAVVSTVSRDGSIHSTVVWINLWDGFPTVNSAQGRLWPTNLERDPHITVVVFDSADPYHFVEIRGTTTGTIEGADEHINALSKKYIDQDEYPGRRPGEQRVRFMILPSSIRYVKQS
ncbi:MAG TPA: TIGR03618 family F420-dependent PPOX class oxidoreductase [Solirubrobacteraceae bacterium]|nr:TIGR03618 family F420-dependent PPOX class oxidoreductase [Solirubrobacteraceae bacterium]